MVLMNNLDYNYIFRLYVSIILHSICKKDANALRKKELKECLNGWMVGWMIG